MPVAMFTAAMFVSLVAIDRLCASTRGGVGSVPCGVKDLTREIGKEGNTADTPNGDLVYRQYLQVRVKIYLIDCIGSIADFQHPNIH